MTEFKQVLLSEIKPDPGQPRKIYDEQAMDELIQSVKEKGILQPILIRPNGSGYKIVCGERRYRAALSVNTAYQERNSIPAVIRELSDDEALELQIIENLQRKDVHPMEEAVAFKSLIEKRSLSVEEVAARVGKKEYFVRQRLKLTELTEKWQTMFYKNAFPLHTAIQVALLPIKQQNELYDDSVRSDDEKSSHPDIKISDWSLNKFKGELHKATFDLNDITLDKKAGACVNCKFNTATAALFADQVTSPRCMNVSCFKHKSDINFGRELKKAKEDPSVILVNSSSGDAGIIQALKKEGHKVLKEYTDFSSVRTPEKPDWEEYKEDYSDEDTPESELRVDFENELKDYEKDLEQFNRKIATGKCHKAFVVDGYRDDKGRYIYIELKKTGGTKSAAMVSAENNPAQDREDIAAEIKRIQDREKRNKELDINKIHSAVLSAVEGVKELKKPGIKHQGAVDRSILIYLLLHEVSDYSSKDKIKAGLKTLPKEPSYNQSGYAFDYFKGLEKITDDELAFMIRTIAISKWGNPKTSGDVHKHDTILRLIAQYSGVDTAAIEVAHAESVLKRQERVNKRIADLKKKKRELEGDVSVKEPVKKPAAIDAGPKKSATKKSTKKSGK